MKFGKLDHVDNIDFSLEQPVYLFSPATNQRTGPVHLYLGTTGWTHKEWKGTFYPEKSTQARHLEYYAQQCNSIELNTTHYRIPTKEMIRKWVGMVPGDFKFCPKVLKYISHSKDLGVHTDRIERFCDHMRGFGSNLGPVFLQLPPYFDPSRLPVLERFLDVFPVDIPLSVELRHEGWFEGARALEMLIAILVEQQRGLVITDVAGRRDVAHMTITAPHLLVRFAGNAGHPSDRERLDQWLTIIREATGKGMTEIHFFAHQPGEAPVQMMHDMRYLADKVGKNDQIITRGPKLLNQQKTLF